jgi:hypothetical protein
MSIARKISAPRTEPAIAPIDEVAEAVEAEGEERETAVELVEVEDAVGSMVDEGDWLVMQDESPDRATVLRKLPPCLNFASIIMNMIWVPL